MDRFVGTIYMKGESRKRQHEML